jgi:hypothetical protein
MYKPQMIGGIWGAIVVPEYFSVIGFILGTIKKNNVVLSHYGQIS